MLLLLKIWIILKCWLGKKLGYIHNIEDEIKFVKDLNLEKVNFEELQKLGIKYEQDKLNGLQFDWQYDSITLLKKKKGDCNSINRFIQVWNESNEECFASYLITYIASPFKKSYTTCINVSLETNNYYYQLADYGYLSKKSKDIVDLIKECALLYQSKTICYVVQDINFKIIDSGYIK